MYKPLSIKTLLVLGVLVSIFSLATSILGTPKVAAAALNPEQLGQLCSMDNVEFEDDSICDTTSSAIEGLCNSGSWDQLDIDGQACLDAFDVGRENTAVDCGKYSGIAPLKTACERGKSVGVQEATADKETKAAIACSKYKGNAKAACTSGYSVNANECKRYKQYKDACKEGAKKAADANKSPKQKAREKAEEAKKNQKEAQKKVDKAQKELDKAQKEAQKICKSKGKDSKECKAAQKKVDSARNALATNKKRLASAKRTAAALASISYTGGCRYKTFFGLTPWYAYLGDEFSSTNEGVNDGGNCTIKCFNFLAQEKANACGVKHSDIPYVLLAVIDSLLRVAGIVAVVFVIISGIKYITSSGNPEATASAQSTLINALIGLAIALVAVAFVSFIGSRIS